MGVYGYPLNCQTSKTYGESLDTATRKSDPFFNTLVRILATRTMNQVEAA